MIAVSGAIAAQAVVTRENDRDTVCLHLVLDHGSDKDATTKAAADAFQKSARIRADSIEFVDSLPENSELLVNHKDS